MGRHRSRHGGELNQRQLRVGEELRHVLAELLLRGVVHDPVIADTHLTVSEVRVTRDLRQATVYVTELGGELSPEVEAALIRATPFLRGEVGRHIHLKYTPSLTFRADESFAEGARIDALLDAAKAGHQPEDREDEDG
jgi:ribosome-binding factor A